MSPVYNPQMRSDALSPSKMDFSMDGHKELDVDFNDRVSPDVPQTPDLKNASPRARGPRVQFDEYAPQRF